MSRPVAPTALLARRIPTAGRIRIGVKGRTKDGKEAPQSIDTFRFTSPDRTALDQIASLYGGDVRSWSDLKAAPGQFEVMTESSVISIALPPDPLGGTPSYELWGNGGRARNCDGETCEMLVQGVDGVELQQTNCICLRKNVLECKLTTRLSVLLPEVRFIGVWRIDTKSYKAAEELPAMVDLIRSLQDKGLTRGLLRIESRRQVVAGKTRQFKVPVLGIDESVEALAAGHARLGAIGAGPSVPVAQLGAGSVEGTGVDPPLVPVPSVDDEVVDAELLEYGSLADRLPVGVAPARALALARKVSEALGLAKPTDVSQVTDERVIRAVVDEVALLNAHQEEARFVRTGPGMAP